MFKRNPLYVLTSFLQSSNGFAKLMAKFFMTSCEACTTTSRLAATTSATTSATLTDMVPDCRSVIVAARGQDSLISAANHRLN